MVHGQIQVDDLLLPAQIAHGGPQGRTVGQRQPVVGVGVAPSGQQAVQLHGAALRTVGRDLAAQDGVLIHDLHLHQTDDRAPFGPQHRPDMEVIAAAEHLVHGDALAPGGGDLHRSAGVGGIGGQLQPSVGGQHLRAAVHGARFVPEEGRFVDAQPVPGAGGQFIYQDRFH